MNEHTIDRPIIDALVEAIALCKEDGRWVDGNTGEPGAGSDAPELEQGRVWSRTRYARVRSAVERFVEALRMPRPVLVSSARISPEDAEKIGAAARAWIAEGGNGHTKVVADPDLAEAHQRVIDWNALHPLGTQVRVRRLVDGHFVRFGATIAPAWVDLKMGWALVALAGDAEPILLDCVSAVEDGDPIDEETARACEDYIAALCGIEAETHGSHHRPTLSDRGIAWLRRNGFLHGPEGGPYTRAPGATPEAVWRRAGLGQKGHGCDAVCPPDRARAGERCQFPRGHVGGHRVGIDDWHPVGSSWLDGTGVDTHEPVPTKPGRPWPVELARRIAVEEVRREDPGQGLESARRNGMVALIEHAGKADTEVGFRKILGDTINGLGWPEERVRQAVERVYADGGRAAGNTILDPVVLPQALHAAGLGPDPAKNMAPAPKPEPWNGKGLRSDWPTLPIGQYRSNAAGDVVKVTFHRDGGPGYMPLYKLVAVKGADPYDGDDEDRVDGEDTASARYPIVVPELDGLRLEFQSLQAKQTALFEKVRAVANVACEAAAACS